MSKSAAPAPPFSSLLGQGFEIKYVSHAAAILAVDFPQATAELETALDDLKLPITEIIGSGGGETKFTQRLRKALSGMKWPKHIFEIDKMVDKVPKQSTSHEIDHVRRFENGVIALEIEWNNKDPFFDRDLENFKRLHDEGAISVGVLITRGQTLQAAMPKLVRRFVDERKIKDFGDLLAHGYEPTSKQRKAVMKQVDRKPTKKTQPLPFEEAWVNNFVKNKYGVATTHWDKLMDRVDRGVGKLTGATDGTDYFYFFCPKCPNKRLLRPIKYTLRAQQDEHPYASHVDVVAPEGFTLAFRLFCDNCLFTDFLKVSNMGWQGGTHEEALGRT